MQTLTTTTKQVVYTTRIPEGLDLQVSTYRNQATQDAILHVVVKVQAHTEIERHDPCVIEDEEVWLNATWYDHLKYTLKNWLNNVSLPGLASLIHGEQIAFYVPRTFQQTIEHHNYCPHLVGVPQIEHVKWVVYNQDTNEDKLTYLPVNTHLATHIQELAKKEGRSVDQVVGALLWRQ